MLLFKKKKETQKQGLKCIATNWENSKHNQFFLIKFIDLNTYLAWFNYRIYALIAVLCNVKQWLYRVTQ